MAAWCPHAPLTLEEEEVSQSGVPTRVPLSGPAWPVALVKQSGLCPGLSPGTCTVRAGPLLAWNFFSLQSPRTAWWGHEGMGDRGLKTPTPQAVPSQLRPLLLGETPQSLFYCPLLWYLGVPPGAVGPGMGWAARAVAQREGTRSPTPASATGPQDRPRSRASRRLPQTVSLDLGTWL